MTTSQAVAGTTGVTPGLEPFSGDTELCDEIGTPAAPNAATSPVRSVVPCWFVVLSAASELSSPLVIECVARSS